jgi:hypothetical protein
MKKGSLFGKPAMMKWARWNQLYNTWRKSGILAWRKSASVDYDHQIHLHRPDTFTLDGRRFFLKLVGNGNQMEMKSIWTLLRDLYGLSAKLIGWYWSGIKNYYLCGTIINVSLLMRLHGTPLHNYGRVLSHVMRV